MSDQLPVPAPTPSGKVLLYHSEDGTTRVEVRLEGETVWLSQKAMAELFQKDVRTVNEHIRNIFDEKELRGTSVIRKFRIPVKFSLIPSPTLIGDLLSSCHFQHIVVA